MSGETKGEETKAAGSMLPNRLTIQPPTSVNSASSKCMYVGFHPDKMRELNFEEGDYICINGTQGLRVVARALQDSDCQVDSMFLCTENRMNIKKRTSDTATVYKVSMIEDQLGKGRGTGVNCVPASVIVLSTSSVQNKDNFPPEELARLVKATFEADYNSEPQGRALYKGALVNVPIPGAGRDILFRVQEIQTEWTGKKLSKYSVPKDSKFGMICSTTEITIGDNIKDKKLQAGIKKTGYADIGGLKKELKKIRELVGKLFCFIFNY